MTKERLLVFTILVIINFGAVNLWYAAFWSGCYWFVDCVLIGIVSIINGIPILVLLAFKSLILFFPIFLLYWYVILCGAVYLYKRFRKKPKVLAGIVLAAIILIAVPAYLIGETFRWFPMPQRDIILLDAFCTGGNTANVLVRNAGVSKAFLRDIKIIDIPTSKVIKDPSWTTADETQSIVELVPGETGRFTSPCTGYCTYRFTYGKAAGASTQTISVVC